MMRLRIDNPGRKRYRAVCAAEMDALNGGSKWRGRARRWAWQARRDLIRHTAMHDGCVIVERVS